MTVTIAATVEADNVPPRVRLDVTGTTELTTTVMRLNPDGTQTPVRTTDGGPLPLPGVVTVVDFGDGTASSDVVTFNSDDTATADVADNGDGTAPESVSGGGGLLYDYEMPFGSLVSYTSLESPGTVSAEVVVPATQVWLIHPGVPELSVPLRLGRGSFTKRTRTVQRALYRPMGRRTPVPFTDGARKSPSSTLVVYVGTEADRQAIDALTDDASTLLLNIPVQLGYNFSTCYISIGDTDLDMATEMVAYQDGFVSLPFDVVDRPVGGTQAEHTWLDVISEYATWADLMAANETWLDVLAGP